MLRRVVEFGLNKVECRRRVVLEYFGENFSSEQCNGSCDNCHEAASGGGFILADVTQHGKNIVDMVRGAKAARVTQTMFIDAYKGSKAKNVGRPPQDFKADNSAHILSEDHGEGAAPSSECWKGQ